MATAAAGSAPGMEGLRPLELGELLDRTFSLYRRNFATFAMIVGVPNLLLFLITSPLQFVSKRATGVISPAGGVFALVFVFGFLIGVILYLICYAASQAAAFFAVSETYLGRPTTFGTAYSQARGKILSLIGVALYVGFATFGGFILFIIPGLIVVCRASVAIPSAMLEDLSPREAFKRSWELTRGFAWRAAAILGLTFILAMVAAFIFQWPFQLAAVIAKNSPSAPVWEFLSGLGGVLSQIVAGPIAFIASTIFYYDLRVRKEAFDLQRLLTSLGGSASPGTLTPGPLGLIR